MKKPSWFSGVGAGVAQEAARRTSPMNNDVSRSFMNPFLLNLPIRTSCCNSG
jgi:hypothetical protein